MINKKTFWHRGLKLHVFATFVFKKKSLFLGTVFSNNHIFIKLKNKLYQMGTKLL